MQLRSWVMRSSIGSLIPCVLIGLKPLLTTGKSGREGGYEASIQKSQACYKVAFIVVDRANTASATTPCGYPLARCLHLPSAGDPAGVRRKAGGLGLRDVGRGRC